MDLVARSVSSTEPGGAHMIDLARGAFERTRRECGAGGEPCVRNLVRRLLKLEGRLTDGTGLVPHSEAWFAYYGDQFGRWYDFVPKSYGRGYLPCACARRQA